MLSRRNNTLAYKYTRRIYVRLIINTTHFHLVETRKLKEGEVLIEEKVEEELGMGTIFGWLP